MAHDTDETVTVTDHLHYVVDLVQHADTPSLVLLASSELGPIAQALLVVLKEHALDARGRCRACSAWWRPWRRQHTYQVWALAHRQLIIAPSDRPKGLAFAGEGPS